MQHIIGGGEDDDNRQLFLMRYNEIIQAARSEEAADPADNEQKANEIKERIIAKGAALAAGE